MRHLTDEQLLAGLRWRYATKRFDSEKKIPAETWKTLEQAPDFDAFFIWFAAVAVFGD